MVSILREAQGGMKFRNVRTRHNTSASRRPAQAPRGGPGGAHRNLEGNHRKKWWVRPACDGWHVKRREECLNREVLGSLAEARVVIEQWRREYNEYRLHSSVG
jgi:transposase InsO family protein